jgi:signal peptidase II
VADKRSSYLLALAIFAVDQLSKWLILNVAHLREVMELVLLPIFSFTYVENRGISLGLLHADSESGRWLLVAMTGAIAVGVAYWMSREEQRGERTALAMVLGGALGNIVDRVRLGYVVDFLDLHFGTFRPFYVFNVADAAISIGVVILLLRAFLASRTKNSESRSHG